ncbi:hypothetical protein EON65_54640 [archaeon]|nr:MAG: hypothetical protein EON65_54640 [archaeon]
MVEPVGRVVELSPSPHHPNPRARASNTKQQDSACLARPDPLRKPFFLSCTSFFVRRERLKACLQDPDIGD